MAKKTKLTKQQLRRMKSNRNKKINQTEQTQFDSGLLGDALNGRVISRFGQHADIEDEQGLLRRCDIRRTIDSLVAGDLVIWRENHAESGNQGVIEAVKPRSSLLTRPDFYDGVKPVAANIEQVVILSAIRPELSLHIIDRYLVAVENMGATPVIAINKADLLTQDERVRLEAELAYYQTIGYQVYWLSVKQAEGVSQVEQILAEQTSIVVGQSGVGKSSLVNRLLPEIDALTNEISDNSGLGTHTTTVARLYHLPSGGDLIDSPGVREFGLWHLTEAEIFDGFVEFEQYRHLCKFRDCKHLDDPKCGLRDAVEKGEIKASRLEHYHKILQSVSENKPSYKIDKPDN
ncbi:small ribosomal subunit biogenesis GTPase RsgA [Catenovulum sp. 2E275]|uniref:small ribosomal subunit biogenesis GTPase RsgA n=1 Tax=Catenovulum sp. 2E275 TaxID=2980497 RepID=UPI0021D37EC9|nr:small ribosomal subunit biogenesis GTPase RsgA [Catenovulum sp. 2E275]MCU4674843.1 small ribosomal subunit biogenesis GTPase RsgA [Catenovulum sp. 2E275]